VHLGGQAAAHERAPHLRDRRRGRAADAGAQGRARGQGGRRGGGRQAVVLRREGDPVGRLHGPGGGLGRPHRERGESGRDQVRQGRVPVGGLRPLAVTGPGGG